MKLLLDANISCRLIPRIAGTFPDSSHVALLGLGDATDDEIWRHSPSCRRTKISTSGHWCPG
ncbi:MAG: DUF5615 family PIN-like protein, partial [Acidimicrobiia bacterium]